jgi:hypothetical protein
MSGELGMQPFGFDVRLGTTFIVQSAGLSAIAVSSLLFYILYSVVRINRGAAKNWSSETHIHYYFVNLLIADLIQAIGGLLSIRWIAEAQVTEGVHCQVQAIFKQIGDVGVALTSLAIALHTFRVLVFRSSPDTKVAVFIVAAVWTTIGIFVGIGFVTNKSKLYYGNTGYWCWITDSYTVQRIVFEYLWLWLAAVVNMIVYGFLALVVVRIVVVEEGRIRISRSSEREGQWNLSNRGASDSGAVAMQLLFYPLVYVVTVAPVAIVRWLAFSGHKIPFAATAFASCLFSLSGLFNVILFRLTRPKLLPTRSQNGSSSFGMLTSTQDTKHTSHTESFACKDRGDFESEIVPWVATSPTGHPYDPRRQTGQTFTFHTLPTQ